MQAGCKKDCHAILPDTIAYAILTFWMSSLLKCSRIDPAVGMSLELRAATMRWMRSAKPGPVSSAPLTRFGLLRLLMSCNNKRAMYTRQPDDRDSCLLELSSGFA